MRLTVWKLMAVVTGLLIAPWAMAGKLPAKLGIYQLPATVAEAAGFDSDDARIYHVIPNSPAGKAGLLPGDLITSFNGKPVGTFQELLEMMKQASAGDKVTIKFERAGSPMSVDVALSAVTGDLTPQAYEQTFKYLEDLRQNHDSLAIRQELITNQWNSNQRNEALARLEEDVKQYPALQPLLLEYLQKTGRYQKYTDQSIRLADENPDQEQYQFHKIEALLGMGRLKEAEIAAGKLASRLKTIWPNGTVHAIELWVTSRLRQGKPLSGDDVPNAIGNHQWDAEELDVFRYWRQQLRGKVPYELQQVDGNPTLQFKKEGVLMGLVPNQMHGIEIKVNGTTVPLAIVDTGASHTLLSTATAQAAGVRIGATNRRASGSLSFTAWPGFVEEMQIGNLIIRNVPVNVGNPPPLVMTKAKAALGIDIMHHIRFTLDYLQNKVHVARASDEPAQPHSPDAVWDIPLWTFSDHCFSRLEFENGTFARALIDSGNFAQTLVWPVWAQDNLLNHPGATSLFVYALSNPRREIAGLKLAGRELPAWPVMDMPPVTLNGIDLLDLLMGHDLLSQYVVTIDMKNRRLRLESPGEKLQPPKAMVPKGLLGL